MHSRNNNNNDFNNNDNDNNKTRQQQVSIHEIENESGNKVDNGNAISMRAMYRCGDPYYDFDQDCQESNANLSITLFP